jgi:hypothetical protein
MPDMEKLNAPATVAHVAYPIYTNRTWQPYVRFQLDDGAEFVWSDEIDPYWWRLSDGDRVQIDAMIDRDTQHLVNVNLVVLAETWRG